MCKSKNMTTDVINPKKKPPKLSRRTASDELNNSAQSSITPSMIHNYAAGNYSSDSSYNYKNSYQSSFSSKNSPLSLRDSLPSEYAYVYDFSEICSATNTFLSRRYSSSSSSASWRCIIRGNDVVVFQRKFRRRSIDSMELAERLSLICKSHYTSVIRLRGASVSGNYIYLVYDYIEGASLADCLRNPRNPNFTILSNWNSRIQIATDIAHGLDYIHHSTGLNLCFVHNHIKSTSIIITEPSLNAKICHFGTAELCGEIEKFEPESTPEISKIKRSDSGGMKLGGTRGYMAPEYQSAGKATQKSDVFAFGIVILELLSGEEPLKYKFSDVDGGYVRISVIETAREAVDGGVGAVRRWVDRRLKDSYPAEVAEKLLHIGLECVEEDPHKRPDMGWVAGRISKLFLESQNWSEKMGVPTDFTVSLAPR